MGTILFRAALGLLAIAVSTLSEAADESLLSGSVPATSVDPHFQELAVVLSATRLRQALADTPAAVTLVDRDYIRQTGARDINELFRLVPGFQVGYNDCLLYTSPSPRD